MTSIAKLRDVTNFWPGPPQWPQWWCCRRGRCQGGPKIVSFCRTEGCRTKIGVEFRQGSNGTIRSSLSTSYDVAQRRAMSPRKCDKTYRHIRRQTDRYTSWHYDDLCPPGSGRKIQSQLSHLFWASTLAFTNSIVCISWEKWLVKLFWEWTLRGAVFCLWKYGNMQACKHASIHVCNFVCMQVCKYESS